MFTIGARSARARGIEAIDSAMHEKKTLKAPKSFSAINRKPEFDRLLGGRATWRPLSPAPTAGVTRPQRSYALRALQCARSGRDRKIKRSCRLGSSGHQPQSRFASWR